MKKSGLADSPFFNKPDDEPATIAQDSPIEKESKSSKSPTSKKTADGEGDTVIPRYHDYMPPRYHDAIIELVRRGVKDFGKEAATHRFTLLEKKQIADIIYTYKNRNIRTSENEITRIAVNFLIEDFRENGEASVLDKVLKALNG
jgi:hypothetical protein